MNKPYRRALCSAVLLALVMPAFSRPLVADDLMRVAEVSAPQLSPDGRSVAYLVSAARVEDDEAATTLWMVDWDGGPPVALTHSFKDVGVPRWSPDGRWLSFLATPPGAEHAQLMLLDRRGGEPRVLTKVSGVIEDYSWSPNTRRLVISMHGAEATAHGKVPLPIVIGTRYFKEDVQGYLGPDTLDHLYLVDSVSGAIEPLTMQDAAHDAAPSWSPDGSQIAFVRSRERGRDADNKVDVMVVDAHGGARMRKLTRIDWPNVQKLLWTADGSRLVLSVGRPAALYAYTSDRLATVPIAGGEARLVTGAPDRAVKAYALSADGRAAEVLVEDDTRSEPARLPLEGGGLEKPSHLAEVVLEASAAAGHTAVIATSDSSPPELYAMEPGSLRRLSHHNDALFAELTLGKVEDLRFKSADGTEVHAVLVKPADYIPGRRYPTIVWIHGGPQGQDEHSLQLDSYSPEFMRQRLAARGYVVLGINYRGSSGRGFQFQSAIAGQWCRKEVADLNAGVDAAIAAGLVDPQRLGVGGWSYGGILTDCLIVDSTRWKAAVSGAGSANQLAMYGADEYLHQYNAELPAPWKDLKPWLDVSKAFFHADRIRTPTLFLGGEKDFNVPISGGEQMYAALHTLGVPTALVVYPGEFHHFVRPSYVRDRAERIQAWFAQYLPTAAP